MDQVQFIGYLSSTIHLYAPVIFILFPYKIKAARPKAPAAATGVLNLAATPVNSDGVELDV